MMYDAILNAAIDLINWFFKVKNVAEFKQVFSSPYLNKKQGTEAYHSSNELTTVFTSRFNKLKWSYYIDN